MSDIPTTRAVAIRLGVTRYFTGKPCVHGHVSERATVNGVCIKCTREREQKRIAHFRTMRALRQQQVA